MVRIHPRPQKKISARCEVIPCCLGAAKDSDAEVAQLIEHQPSKLRVASLSLVFRSKNESNCQCSSVVEHFLGKEEVTGSNPVIGSIITPRNTTPTVRCHCRGVLLKDCSEQGRVRPSGFKCRSRRRRQVRAGGAFAKRIIFPGVAPGVRSPSCPGCFC